MDLLFEQSSGVIQDVAFRITLGIYEGEEKWALYNEQDELLYYAMNYNCAVATVVDDILPEDISYPGKYLYQDGAIVPNPDWVAPPPTIEEQVSELSDDISDDWNSKIIYKVGEYTMYAGKLWICKIQHESMAPAVNSPYWENVNVASEFNRLAKMIKEA